MFWIKNTDGKPDAMLTFALISFAVVTINLFLATFGSVSIYGQDLGFQFMDASTMTAYLAATFGAYVSRRWTDRKYGDGTLESSGVENG